MRLLGAFAYVKQDTITQDCWGEVVVICLSRALRKLALVRSKHQMRLCLWPKWSIYAKLEGSFQYITHSSYTPLNVHEFIPSEYCRHWSICLGADWVGGPVLLAALGRFINLGSTTKA